MRRRQTLFETKWPTSENFVRLAECWQPDASERCLEIIWNAYDLLRSKVLSDIDWSLVGEDLEREITQLFEMCIRDSMTGYEPFYAQHGPYEPSTRLPSPAQPPEYDIAFVWRENPRVMWPLEAKVLNSEASVGQYVNDLRLNFLTGRYAPFSGEGAMLGYLRRGDGKAALQEIGRRVPCSIEMHPAFPSRVHGVSEHRREVPTEKGLVEEFRCHHLMMPMGEEPRK